MRSLSSSAIAQALKQHGVPCAWLFDLTLEYSTTAVRTLYVTSYDQPITWSSRTWYPYPIECESLSFDSTGNLPEFQLSMSNLTREVSERVHNAKGLSGLPCVIYLVNLNALGSGDALLGFTFEVLDAFLSNIAAVFRLGRPSWFDYRAPPDTYVRGQCRHVYKGMACAYRGSLPTCDLTLFGANGCVVHGDDEFANNQPRMHPRRFGGFPALPRYPV